MLLSGKALQETIRSVAYLILFATSFFSAAAEHIPGECDHLKLEEWKGKRKGERKGKRK